MALDSSYFKAYKTTLSSSFYTVYCKDIAIIKLVVTGGGGGGYLEFFHEKVKKMETVFFSPLG